MSPLADPGDIPRSDDLVTKRHNRIEERELAAGEVN
jgi:hypothetical protein